MDQIPGNPSLVRDQATSMVKAAERMRSAADTLKQIDSGAYDSDAIDAVFVNTTEVAGVLRGASTRYRGTGEALQRYADVLDSAQQQAREANDKLAGTNVDGAVWDVASKQAAVSNPLLLLPDREAERDQVHRELVQAKQELHAQQAQANDAHEQWQRAKDEVDQAAEEAIRRIHIAVEDSGLKDALWDDFTGWIDRNLDVIQVVIDALAAVCSIVALLTVAFPPVAAAFAVAALALSVTSLAITLRQHQKGEKGDAEVAVDVVFALTSIIPGARAVTTVVKTAGKHITKNGLAGLFAKDAVKAARNPTKILFDFDPAEEAFKGQSRWVTHVWKRHVDGLVPDEAIGRAKDWVKGELEEQARGIDSIRSSAPGSMPCYSVSTGGR